MTSFFYGEETLQFLPGDVVYAVVPYQNDLHQFVGTLRDFETEIMSDDPMSVHTGEYRTCLITGQPTDERVTRDAAKLPREYLSHVYLDENDQYDAADREEKVIVKRIIGFNITVDPKSRLPFTPSKVPKANQPRCKTKKGKDENGRVIIYVPIRHVIERVPSTENYEIQYNKCYPLHLGEIVNAYGSSEVIGQTVTGIMRHGGRPVYFVRIIRQKTHPKVPSIFMMHQIEPFMQFYKDDIISYCHHSENLVFRDADEDFQKRYQHQCGRVDVYGFPKDYRNQYLKALKSFVENIKPVEIMSIVVPDDQRYYDEARMAAMTEIDKRLKLHWYAFTEDDTYLSKSNEVRLEVAPNGIQLKHIKGAPRLQPNESVFTAGLNDRGDHVWFRIGFNSESQALKAFIQAVETGQISSATVEECRAKGEDTLWSQLIRGYLNPRTKHEPVQQFKETFLWHVE